MLEGRRSRDWPACDLLQGVVAPLGLHACFSCCVVLFLLLLLLLLFVFFFVYIQNWLSFISPSTQAPHSTTVPERRYLLKQQLWGEFVLCYQKLYVLFCWKLPHATGGAQGQPPRRTLPWQQHIAGPLQFSFFSSQDLFSILLSLYT